MKESYFYSVKDLSKAQNLSMAYFLYLISLDIDNFRRAEKCQSMYIALVNVLNLKEHSRLVIQAVINLHIK
jgi:hypothetical protein